MVKALFDTNILIDYLRGISAARAELGRYADKAISIISWMEVLAGAPPAAESGTRDFLDSFIVIDLDHAVAEHTVALRREHRIKLPDAIVWASARVHSMLLVTRDVRDFRKDDPGVRVPYSV